MFIMAHRAGKLRHETTKRHPVLLARTDCILSIGLCVNLQLSVCSVGADSTGFGLLVSRLVCLLECMARDCDACYRLLDS
jgi:hypothetical protein